jgi:hypothetical protein
MIDTESLWLPSTFSDKWSNTAETTTKNVLATIIKKLILAFWILSLLIMTIGWWYMIFSHGQDELLNKWKGIFTAWLTSLIIALGSWIIIKVVISLLY